MKITGARVVSICRTETAAFFLLASEAKLCVLSSRHFFFFHVYGRSFAFYTFFSTLARRGTFGGTGFFKTTKSLFFSVIIYIHEHY